MSAAPASPAGAWRRYVAWSLDFVPLASVATVLSWPRIAAAWQATTAAWTRLSALLGGALVDGLMQGASPPGLVASVLSDPDVQSAADHFQQGLAQLLAAWVLAYALLAAPYHVGFERWRWQGSPGKHALRLRVVDARGDRPAGAWRLAGRHLAGVLSWLSLNLGHALAALPPERRALHDRLTRTRVVSDCGDAPLPGWARAWLVLQVVASFAALAWGARRCFSALQATLAA